MECGKKIEGRVFCNIECSQKYTRKIQEQEANKMTPEKWFAKYGECSVHERTFRQQHDRKATALEKHQWYEIREKAYRRDNFKCVICGHHSEDIYSTITGDHITPRSIGGKLYDLKNIWTLCDSCNAIKTMMDDKAAKDFHFLPITDRKKFVVNYRNRIRKWARDLKKSLGFVE